jgi:hypothetical protein
MRHISDSATQETYDTIKDVFRQMRHMGYICRTNFSCCSGCAGYELAEIASQRLYKGWPVAGVVFWHHQDHARMLDDGILFIRFGDITISEQGTFGQPDWYIGKVAYRMLKDAGLDVEWDGDSKSCIKVTVS